jgi:hypothetical protein
MNKNDLELLRGAIHAGLEFEYPTAFGKTAKANPHDVVQRSGAVYLHFIKGNGEKIERRLDSCFAVAGTPGFKDLERAGMIEFVTAKAGKVR